MLVYIRHAWGWTALGAGLSAAFLAGYWAIRIGWSQAPPSIWEPLLILLVVAVTIPPVITLVAQRKGQALLNELVLNVAALRGKSTSARKPVLSPELGPLYNEINGLAQSYRKALDELLLQQEVNREEAPSDVNMPAFPGRADAEQGRSLFGSQGSTNSRKLIARLTPQAHWVSLTPALRQLLGFSFERLKGRPFAEIVHPDNLVDLRRAFHEALEIGEGHNIVFRVLPQDGSERYLQMDVLTRYDEQAAPLHFRCHFLDITERVQTERELRRRTEELSQANARLQRINQDLETLKRTYGDLYHKAPVMFFSLDSLGRFVVCNETFERTLGYRLKELRGMPFTQLLAPECRDSILMSGANCQLPPEVQTRCVKKEGTTIDVWIRTSPLLDEGGAFVRSRSAAQDMTEHNRLANALRAKAEELQKANTQLRRINRELDDFTYVVSHDLKEPLRTVEAFSNFLAQDYGPQLGEEGQEFITNLIQASRRLGTLIDDLLNLSRAGRITHVPQAFDLTNVVSTVRRDLADLIQRKAATVRIDGTLPAVAGDPQRITQLLANLVGNGLKYNTNPQPEIVIGTTTHDVFIPHSDPDLQLDAAPVRSPEPLQVTVFVRDNGIGIDPKYHQQIFRIFRRLHRREDYEGTGAGLAICKKIIEAHGGKIWIESQLGQGATFFFTLPKAITLSESTLPRHRRADDSRLEIIHVEEIESSPVSHPVLMEL